MSTQGTNKPIPRDLTREKWNALLSQISEKVQKKAFDQNLSVTVVKDNQIIKLFKDGTIEVLEQLEEVERKTTGKTLNIA